MFTGLIQEIGTVYAIARRGGYFILDIAYDASLGPLKTGDSMAVNGVCLTATSVEKDRFRADLSAETQRSTTLGKLKRAEPVNLERPVTVSDPLGGHIVLGHVDATGRLRRVSSTSGGLTLSIGAPTEVMDLVVEKGSITVDGVSLTVGSVSRDTFEVYLIPETQARTTLHRKRAGDFVNVETDYLAKLVRKFMSPRPPRGGDPFSGS